MTTRKSGILGDETGASTPEYAVILVVVLAAIISVGTVLGGNVSKTYSLSALGSQESVSKPAPATDEGSLLTSIQEYIPEISEEHASIAFVIGQSVLAISMVTLLLLRRKKKKPKRDPIVKPEEVFASQANSILLALRHQSANFAEWEPQARHFMNANFEAVAENTRFEEVESRLELSVCNTVVVIGRRPVVAGIITAQDLTEGATAKQMASGPPLSFEATMPIARVLRTMLQHGCTFAMVQQGDKPIGVISHVELITALQASLQVLKESHAQHRDAMLRMLGPEATMTQHQPMS